LLSIASDRALSFDECAKAFPDLPAKSVHDCLQELLRMEFARLEGGLFTVAHRGLHAALRHGSDQADMNRAHHALAEIFAARGNEGFRQAKHSLRAGDTARGVDVLIAFARQTQSRTDNDPGEYVQLVASLPDDWLDVFEAAILGCRQLGRVRTDLFQLRYRLTSLLNVMAAPIAASQLHLLALIRQLCEDSGLDDYADLDAGIDPGQRLKQALGAAKQRFDANPVEHRGVEPSLAIRALVRAQLQAAGVIALAIDYPLAAVLPSIAPLTPLSPAFGVMEKVIGAVAARVAGRQEHAREVYQQVLERTAQPDLAGLDTSNHRFLRYGIMYGLAVIEAGMGLSSCLAWAQKLEAEPLHAVNALQVQMLYELWLGRVPEADQVRAHVELRRIESSSRQMADGTHLVWQTIAHAYSDDLTHLKQVIEDLRLFARRYPGWTRVVAYALAEYHRARGNLASANEHVTTALRNMAAGTHQIWPHAAGLQVTILTDLGRADEAATLGDRYLLAGAAADLGYLTNYIRMPLAMAYARLGQHERASELAEHALRVFSELGTSGLNLVVAYETRSRVALLASHSADYSHFAARCAEECARTGGRVLRAKHDRLVWAANASLLAPAEATAEPLPLSTVESMLRSVFDDAVQPRARAQQALQLLLSNSGAVEGVLYLIGERGLEPAAQVGRASTALELITRVRDFIDVELAERGIVTATLLGAESSNGLTTCVGPQRLVLLSHQTSAGLAVTGVVALLSRPGMPFHPPGTLAARLSRMLAEAGDVVPLMSA
jgi:tetratricopeptide (TPR) repeat protein